MRCAIQRAAIGLLATFTAYSFHQSVEKDLTTGAYTRGDGLSSGDVVIETSGQAGATNEFVCGETVNFVFNNVKGFQKDGDKVFSRLSLYIIGNEKDTVLAYPDLLENKTEGTSLSPLQLQANFVAALPYRNNQNYRVHIRIWDKKGDGTLSYELPFTVAESDLLDIQSQTPSITKASISGISIPVPAPKM